MPNADAVLRVSNHFASQIKRRRIAEMAAGMRETRFVGRILLITEYDPFEEDVELCEFQVAPGKPIFLAPHVLGMIVN